MSSNGNLDRATPGFPDDSDLEKLKEQVRRGAAAFWRRRGIPEPKADFRDDGNMWQRSGKALKKRKSNNEQQD